MSRFFIYRPIFASVISIVIVLAGFVSFGSLPVAKFPPIAPPTVSVTAVYPGGDARTIADTVATPIEQQVNGVEGMSSYGYRGYGYGYGYGYAERRDKSSAYYAESDRR